MTTTTLASAERWLAYGVAPIPILPRDKRPARPWLEFRFQLPTFADLLAWFSDGSGNNVAIVCGWKNLVVLDFDSIDAWRDWLDWLEQVRPDMYLAVLNARQTTTARGKHLYVHLAQPARTRPLPALGIDIKAQGGYVLVPPSIHPSGVRYSGSSPDARVLTCDVLSDLLPAGELVRTGIEDVDPASSIRIVLPDSPAPPSSDPWDIAEHAVEFDQARGLARIKNAFRIEEWFPQRTPSSRDGRWFLATCPWHDDKHPSFWIDTQRQLCGCHAGCTPKPYDVIDLVARVCSVSNAEAIRRMSQAAAGR